MAEIQESGNKKKGGKNKQKKMTVRVDFTPMVDMNMLLITFFMLCTSLSKPQTMEISMPSNDKNVTEEQQSKVRLSHCCWEVTINCIITMESPTIKIIAR